MTLKNGQKLEGMLREFGPQLAELFITSQAAVGADAGESAEEPITAMQGSLVNVAVYRAKGQKCERCWRVLPDVGSDPQQPGLCNRCVDVLRRHYKDASNTQD